MPPFTHAHSIDYHIQQTVQLTANAECQLGNQPSTDRGSLLLVHQLSNCLSAGSDSLSRSSSVDQCGGVAHSAPLTAKGDILKYILLFYKIVKAALLSMHRHKSRILNNNYQQLYCEWMLLWLLHVLTCAWVS